MIERNDGLEKPSSFLDEISEKLDERVFIKPATVEEVVTIWADATLLDKTNALSKVARCSINWLAVGLRKAEDEKIFILFFGRDFQKTG